MVRRAITVLPLLLAALTTSGCFNSESDYQEMVERKESLKTQLATATKENEILTEALNNIKKEQENLNILANTARSRISSESSLAPPTTAPLQPLDGDQSTISWGGWEWAIPPDALPDTVDTNDRGSSSTTTTASSSGGRIYRPRQGDVLSIIASRNNTTVAELVRLNPYLKDRRGYMIWETDEILLP